MTASLPILPESTGAAPDPQIDFFSLSQEDLAALLKERYGEPAYRAKQLFQWVYRQGITDIALMTNVKRELREELQRLFVFTEAAVADRQISSDGTRKYLLEVTPGDNVESVMIKQPQRMTLCVSSQIGCGMACAFCRTGTMGFRRHLSTAEIIRQVRAVIKDAANFGDMFQNIVFMGMGEPLHNFKGVTTALRILTDPDGLNLSTRKITVSTVGLVPAIERFGASGVDVNLAVSLNATTDEVRDEIMPVNRTFPIERLLAALRAFPLKPRRRITIEYVMLAGVNDTPADLERLPKLLRGIPSKINLIPYNENAGLGFKAPSAEKVHTWHRALLAKGLNTTVRWSKGADISAACGQLAVKAAERKALKRAMPILPPDALVENRPLVS
ncbi:MAG: rRNA ((2503)-C(2))-methyltransferase RlmN [Pseudomonadota bacterium]|jgi:23S rRNA (adenine2503-C2)-methyltransferase